MKKITYTNEMPYTYEPTHKGAPYVVGGKYKNHGQYIESVVKYHLGIEFVNCPSTSYDKGSDIEETSTSVKSERATLATVYGETKTEVMCEYFNNVASNKWIYATETNGTITEYQMNKTEFANFLNRFATLERESGKTVKKLRLKREGLEMRTYLENMAEG